MKSAAPAHVKVRHLVEIARALASGNPGRPKQAYLRRAVSSAYYAMFHALARCCADTLIGSGKSRSDPAWAQVYRSLEHGYAKQQCQSERVTKFPKEIQDFAQTFASVQTMRHDADYDPTVRYDRSAVLVDIGRIEAAISAFDASSVGDRRAFSAFVLLRTRKG
jgi:uncharacterized protein (UPF0332 family)